MRLFAALPLPEAARRALAEAVESLRAEGWPVRWTDTAQLHLTLKFYGEVEPARVAELAHGLGAAARGTGPVLVETTQLGTLPGGRAARVIVADVEPIPALELLQHRIERESEAAGFPPEGRPFRPHLTLARLRQGERLPAAARGRLARQPIAVSALVETVELYESRPGAGGHRHHSLRSYPLGA